MEDHITRARRLIDRATTEPTKSSVTTIADILAAENRLQSSEAEFRDYSDSEDGMRATIDASGVVGTVIERYRVEKLEMLRDKISRRKGELAHVKLAWLADTKEH